jgi:hypothetical protein
MGMFLPWKYGMNIASCFSGRLGLGSKTTIYLPDCGGDFLGIKGFQIPSPAVSPRLR